MINQEIHKFNMFLFCPEMDKSAFYTEQKFNFDKSETEKLHHDFSISSVLISLKSAPHPLILYQ